MTALLAGLVAALALLLSRLFLAALLLAGLIALLLLAGLLVRVLLVGIIHCATPRMMNVASINVRGCRKLPLRRKKLSQ
jgi:hypothetical protein